MKRGPLSNKEKQFIDSNKSMSVQEVAEKLERSVAVVSKYVETQQDGETTPTHNLFARKEEQGVTVMTEAASMAADDNRSKRNLSSPKRYKGVIHKIKED
jgi:predicted transcriptional regulator